MLIINAFLEGHVQIVCHVGLLTRNGAPVVLKFLGKKIHGLTEVVFLPSKIFF
jgi:hypothetical protein